MKQRLAKIAEMCGSPTDAARVLEQVLEAPEVARSELEAASEFFLARLADVFVTSPVMLQTLLRHPGWLGWLRREVDTQDPGQRLKGDLEAAWRQWSAGEGRYFASALESLRTFKRREYLALSYLDLAGFAGFDSVVRRLSDLADLSIRETLGVVWNESSAARPASLAGQADTRGLAVFALGKLGARELNYSSDVDLLFCRRFSEHSEELRFFTKLGERMVLQLSAASGEGFLYRVDMRLRPHGETGPLVPTLNSLVGYYESWGEPWERQALIKVRFVAGDAGLGGRFEEFAAKFAFARPMEEGDLEEIKRVKHRAEREHSIPAGKFNVKQGPGGIRDIEFYVQFLQLVTGWKASAARAPATLEALQGLAQAKVLLEGEETQLALAYLFLRALEHRLQLRSLTPDVLVPDSPEQRAGLARSLGYRGPAAGDSFDRALGVHRARVRAILERIYLTPGYLRLRQRDEELAQLLSERTPRGRVQQVLGDHGFRDPEKAWQNLRLLALGPSRRMLPPPERRAFLEFLVPLLGVLRDSIDPDLALHRIESFATATGNRVSFLRALTSRRPHLVRLVNLLALSNRCHQILVRHPEYFDTLARGVHLHEGRSTEEMADELRSRLLQAPAGADPGVFLRRFRQRELLRVAYRDLAGLADSREVGRELSALATACLHVAIEWTAGAVRSSKNGGPGGDHRPLHCIGLGRLGSAQMHYASDLDLVFLYDSDHGGEAPGARAALQQAQERRVEGLLELVAEVTSEGTAYPVDLRLRPEGSAGMLARSWEAFLEYAERYMQPWERMALVRSRQLDDGAGGARRWDEVVGRVTYLHEWTQSDFEAIRHLKRRIEKEKSRETRVSIDFKYGKGGITDLEFLVQLLQIRHGVRSPELRRSSVSEVLPLLARAGALRQEECERLTEAHDFQRKVENRYQLIEEWTLREISRESPVLQRLARSLGYSETCPHGARRAFLADWEERALFVRRLVDRYFYAD